MSILICVYCTSLCFAFFFSKSFWKNLWKAFFYFYFCNLKTCMELTFGFECVFLGCVYGCYIYIYILTCIFFFSDITLSLISVDVSFTCHACHVTCCMLGRLEVKNHRPQFKNINEKLTSDLFLCLSLSCLYLSEWIHPFAYRCPLRERQRGHAAAEPRGGSWLHSKGTVPHPHSQK